MEITRSGWRSMVIKSIRMGWPNGVRHAGRHTTTGDLKYLLRRQVWEDIFPHPDELHGVYAMIDRLDIDGLLRIDTHHGKGLSSRFCDLADDAVAVKDADKGDPMWSEKTKIFSDIDVFVPSAVFNCAWTWLQLVPDIPKGRVRALDTTDYAGVPPAMLDGHTREGRQLGQQTTILSGSYDQHRTLGRLVRDMGWLEVRTRVHEPDPIQPAGNLELFD